MTDPDIVTYELPDSGNVAPKTKWDYFKSAPRPLLKYICVPLVAVAVMCPSISLEKLKALLVFAAALFTVRGCEKIADMWTARK